MKKILYFYLEVCPHCKKADEFLRELQSENPRYNEIEIEKVEETQHPEISSQYDYYYVPTLFWGEKKLFEGVPSKEALKKALDEVLEG